jgi:hypothetical protein
MRKILLQEHFENFALEIRLEECGLGRFLVIIAGMTYNIRSGHVKGVFEATTEDDYMFIENETYKEFEFTRYAEAKKLFDALSGKYRSK